MCLFWLYIVYLFHKWFSNYSMFQKWQVSVRTPSKGIWCIASHFNRAHAMVVTDSRCKNSTMTQTIHRFRLWIHDKHWTTQLYVVDTSIKGTFLHVCCLPFKVQIALQPRWCYTSQAWSQNDMTTLVGDGIHNQYSMRYNFLTTGRLVDLGGGQNYFDPSGGGAQKISPLFSEKASALLLFKEGGPKKSRRLWQGGSENFVPIERV